MIQLHVDGAPVTTENLTQLKTSEIINRAGTMVIGLPPDHPARDAILAPKAVITLEEDGELQFRGRVLSHQTLTDRQETITCEGELAFFQDTYVEPAYGPHSDADSLIRVLVALHNEKADEAHQFTVGSLYSGLRSRKVITDASDPYIPIFDVLTGISDSIQADGIEGAFLTAKNGVLSLSYSHLRTTQNIIYGENLISLTKTGYNSDFCTVLYADGSGDDGTAYSLLSIQANPYVVDAEKVAEYGWIAKYVHFEGVESAQEVLSKAQTYLSRHNTPTGSRQIKALDRHWIDKAIPRFRAGDFVKIYSEPHGVYTNQYLQSVDCDWLHPEANVIEIGNEAKLV